MRGLLGIGGGDPGPGTDPLLISVGLCGSAGLRGTQCVTWPSKLFLINRNKMTDNMILIESFRTVEKWKEAYKKLTENIAVSNIVLFFIWSSFHLKISLSLNPDWTLSLSINSFPQSFSRGVLSWTVQITVELIACSSLTSKIIVLMKLNWNAVLRWPSFVCSFRWELEMFYLSVDALVT